ncbi:MAG: hypothetical protein K6G26_03250 [Lachnospiraceae bacterium]|nr:hypothetical protein [Lachnospiraceae bacterium]
MKKRVMLTMAFMALALVVVGCGKTKTEDNTAKVESAKEDNNTKLSTKTEEIDDAWEKPDEREKDFEVAKGKTYEMVNKIGDPVISFYDYLFTGYRRGECYLYKINKEECAAKRHTINREKGIYLLEGISISNIKEIDKLPENLSYDEAYGITCDINVINKTIDIAFVDRYIIVNEGKELYEADFDVSKITEKFTDEDKWEEGGRIYFPCAWYLEQISKEWNTLFMEKAEVVKDDNIVYDIKVSKAYGDKVDVTTTNNSDKDLIDCKSYGIVAIVNNEPYYMPYYGGMQAPHVALDYGNFPVGDTFSQEVYFGDVGPLKKGTYGVVISDTYGKFNIE